jgi:membrane associated rhomboid family serine protease
VYGILEKKYIPIAISIGVALVYGGLIWGIFPSVKSYISWEGHLFGAIAGVLIAFLLKNYKH